MFLKHCTNWKVAQNGRQLVSRVRQMNLGIVRSNSVFSKNYAHSKDSNYSTYKEMFDYMQANADEVLPPDNDSGLKKVLREDYAFLMESSSIKYITERYCNVTQIGGLLDAKGYGIAMKKCKRSSNDA